MRYNAVVPFFLVLALTSLALAQEPQPDCQALVAKVDADVKQGRENIADLERRTARAAVNIAKTDADIRRLEALLATTGPLWRSDPGYIKIQHLMAKTKLFLVGMRQDLNLAREALTHMVQGRDQVARGCWEGKKLLLPPGTIRHLGR